MLTIDNPNEIIKCLCANNNNIKCKFNYTDVESLVKDSIEKSTGCTLFNKSKLLEEIKTELESNPEKLFELASKSISKNLIPQIKFDTMFKSNLEFSLVFNQDNILVLYKNKKIDLELIDEVKKDLLENKLNYLPVITELYINNICNIIEKLINKDLSVKYYLIDFPIPYWKLFEIKSLRTNKDNLSTIKHLEDIISGKNYTPDPIQIYNDPDPDDELKAILVQIEEFENNKGIKKYSLNKKELNDNQKKELDIQYRMEVMSYLNDNDIVYFLDKLDLIDKQEKNIIIDDTNLVTIFVKIFLDFIAGSPNKMIKIYGTYRMFDFITQCESFMNQHDGFRTTVANKINELTEDLVIMQTAGLALSTEITDTMNKSKELIDKIEKQKNPSYIPKWNNSSQQEIINQIMNQNNNINITNNYSNNYEIESENDSDIHVLNDDNISDNDNDNDNDNISDTDNMSDDDDNHYQ